MGTVNLTDGDISPAGISHDFQQPVTWTRYRVVNATHLTGSAGDTYQVAPLAAETALVDGFIVVTTVFGAATNGTMQIKVNSATLTGAILVDALAKGTVIRLFPNDFEDTAGNALYVTAADTVDLVTGTAEPATGEFDLYLGTIKIVDNV